MIIRLSPIQRRRAFLLLLVLLVVSGISLTAVSLSESMLMSYEESLLTSRAIQARCAADSGLAAARLFLANDKQTRLDSGGVWDNPAYFQAVNVVPDSDPQELCHFSILAPNLDEFGYYASARYGLQNESARLNLNALITIDKLMGAASSLGSALGNASSGLSALGMPSELAGSAESAVSSGGVGQQLLMGLPGMTEEIADAILDYIDEDDEPRPYGAESEYYSLLPTPYSAANGPLVSVDELLLVRGVTPQLLFGLDQNRNGVLDSFEQATLGTLAADSSTPNAIIDPNTQQLMPQLGWAQYLTLYSREKNVDSEGNPRINLNGTDLALLQTDLSAALGNEEWASFILAYRALGPGDANASNVISTGGQGGAGGGGGGGRGGQDGDRGGPGAGGPGGGRGGPGGGGPGAGGPGGGRGGPGGGPGGGGPGAGGPGGGRGGPGGGPGGGGPGAGGPGGGRGGPGGGPGAGGQRGGRLGNNAITADFPLAMQSVTQQIPRGYFVAMQRQGGGGGAQGQGGGQAGGPGGGRGGLQAAGPPGGGQGGRGGQDGGRGGQDGGRGGQDGGRGGQDGGRGGQDGGRGGQDGGRGGQDGGRGGQGGGRGGQGGAGGLGVVGARQEAWKSDAVQVDLTAQPKGQFNQILDLIGATITVNQGDQPVTYKSPFQDNPLEMALYLPILMDKLTTVEGPIIPGRININEAPIEIVSGIPGMTPELVEQLMAARAQQSDSENRKFETWPMIEGYVSLQQMRSLLPLVSGGGDVYRAQVIGYYEQGAAFARVEAVIDAAEAVPTVVSYRRLDHLGRGFTNAVLGQRSLGIPIAGQ